MIVVGVPIWDGSFKYLTPFLYGLKHLNYPKEDLGLVFAECCVKENPDRIKQELEGPYQFVKFFHTPTYEWGAKSIAHNQNVIRQEVLSRNDADFLFSLESDNPPPPHALERLLKINSESTPITSGVYARKRTRDPMISRWKSWDEPYGDNEEESFWNLYKKGGVVEVDKTGFGCMLIRRSVLEMHPFCDPVGTASSDSTTCVKWRKEGLKILCDTGLQIPHIADEIKLHVGCGANHLWDYVNIDVNPGVHPDVILDVTEEHLPFDDGTVDKVESYHFLEHLSRAELPFHLKDCLRVLKRGGIMKVSVPDLEYVCKYYLAHPEELWALKLIFGGQEDDRQFHKNGWSKDTLKKTFEKTGFTVQEVKNIDSHMQESISLTAVKS